MTTLPSAWSRVTGRSRSLVRGRVNEECVFSEGGIVRRLTNVMPAPSKENARGGNLLREAQQANGPQRRRGDRPASWCSAVETRASVFRWLDRSIVQQFLQKGEAKRRGKAGIMKTATRSCGWRLVLMMAVRQNEQRSREIHEPVACTVERSRWKSK